MFDAAKNFIKASPLMRPLIAAKGLMTRPRTQNDEAAILADLVMRHAVPRRFVEFGFSGWEFNCAELARTWDGLLIDGDQYNVTIASTILPRRVVARQHWLTLDTLDMIPDYLGGRELGILSIDVDGNDYWFLEALISLRPAIIISEYNSVLGQRSISVPYDPAFDRRQFGDGWYYGASLAALAGLAARHGYALVAQTGGINAFFVRDDLLTADDRPMTAAQAYQPRRADKWAEIAHLPFVDVAP